MRLWQQSWLQMLGQDAEPVAAAGARATTASSDEEWQNNFVFDYRQAVLPDRRAPHPRGRVAASRACPSETRKKVDFFTRQYVDALSPSNFALTNPQVLRETLDLGGQNLRASGLNNLLEDIERGDGQLRISMTDAEGVQDRPERRHHAGQGGVPERPDAADPVRADDRRRCIGGRC